MADFMMDPFYALSREVESTNTKVADSVFENYKLQVSQANDINNRAMQVALHDTAAFAELKEAIGNSTLQTMLAAARTDAAIGATAMATQALIMEEDEATRGLIAALNTQNLNTALINSNTALVSDGVGYQGLGLTCSGLGAATQSVVLSSAVNALHSQVGNQSLINTGAMSASTQTQSPTNVR